MVVRTYIFVILLLVGGYPIFAQSALDSLETKLAAESNDSVRFLLLIKLSSESEFYDYSKARKYADDATLLADKLDAPWAKGKLFFRLAFLEAMEGDFAEALKYDLQGFKLHTETKDSLQLSRTLNDLGTDYRDLGEYDEAYYYLTEGYRIASKHHKIPQHDDSIVMAIALHNIGTVFTELGQFDIARDHLNASFKLFNKFNYSGGTPYAFDELGELYQRHNRFEEALEQFQKALSLTTLRRPEIGVPEIVAGGGHHEQHEECNDAERFKRETLQRGVAWVRREQRDQRVHVGVAVIPEQCQPRVSERQQKARHAHVAAVVE